MSQSKDNRNHKKNKSFSCHKCKSKNNNNNKSPTTRETRSTQTDSIDRLAERPEVEVKITDYTCNSSDSQCSSATSLSRECSRHSGSCPPSPSSSPRPGLRSRSRLQSRSVQPDDAAAIRAQIAAGYESSSDSDNMEGRAVPSYDYLEGSRIVTSLTDLRLSDSDDEPNPVEEPLTAEYSTEHKLPKFL